MPDMPAVSKAQFRYFAANRDKLEKEGVDVDEWLKGLSYNRLPERKSAADVDIPHNPSTPILSDKVNKSPNADFARKQQEERQKIQEAKTGIKQYELESSPMTGDFTEKKVAWELPGWVLPAAGVVGGGLLGNAFVNSEDENPWIKRIIGAGVGGLAGLWGSSAMSNSAEADRQQQVADVNQAVAHHAKSQGLPPAQQVKRQGEWRDGRYRQTGATQVRGYMNQGRWVPEEDVQAHAAKHGVGKGPRMEAPGPREDGMYRIGQGAWFKPETAEQARRMGLNDVAAAMERPTPEESARIRLREAAANRAVSNYFPAVTASKLMQAPKLFNATEYPAHVNEAASRVFGTPTK